MRTRHGRVLFAICSIVVLGFSLGPSTAPAAHHERGGGIASWILPIDRWASDSGAAASDEGRGSAVAGEEGSSATAAAHGGTARAVPGKDRDPSPQATARAGATSATRSRPKKQQKYAHLGFEWPVGGWITSRFGRRTSGFHHGIDIACRKWAWIKTAKQGKVTLAGRLPVYGLTVVVRHDSRFTTLYAHMSHIHVRPGQRVERGDVIGKCGSTGHSTGNHVHFEIRRSGRNLNPAPFLPISGPAGTVVDPPGRGRSSGSKGNR